MTSRKEVKKINLTIPKNIFLLDGNKLKNHFKIKQSEKEKEETENSNFHFFKNFKLKNPKNLKENYSKNNYFIKRKKTKSLEINFLNLNNENDLPVEKYENLPKIETKAKTKHVMSKSQINFKSILSENNNLIVDNNSNNNVNKNLNFVDAVDEKLSAPKSKQSKRVVFTKCVSNQNNNFNFYGKNEEYNDNNNNGNNINKKFIIKADSFSSNLNSNANNKYNNPILKSYLTGNSNNYIPNNRILNNINSIKSNINLLQKDNINNNLNLYSTHIDEANEICIFEASPQTLNYTNNNYDNNNNNIKIKANLYNNYIKNSNLKENTENNSINNINNSHSNLSPNLERTPIKPKNNLKTHFRNLSTNIKSLDLNFNGIHEKAPNASTDRTDICTNIISKKISNKSQNSNSNNSSIDDNNKDFINFENISIRNYNNNYNNQEQEIIIKTSNLIIQENSFPYSFNFLKQNSGNKINNIDYNLIKKNSIINPTCNPSTGTNTNLFKQRRKDVKKFI